MMSPRTRHTPSRTLVRFGRIAALSASLFGPAIASAQQVDTIVTQIIGIKNSAEQTYTDGRLQTDLELTPYSFTKVEIRRKLDSGAQLRFGAHLRVIGFPETSAATEVEPGLTAEYHDKFGAGNAYRYRIRGVIDTQREHGEKTFDRIRIGGRLQYRHDKFHTSSARLRWGYRNQNEATTFSGYDQSEYLVELGHTWRPWGDKRILSATVFGEARRAEADRFSYNEFGIRFGARAPLNDKTDIFGRISTYNRNYRADSAGFSREDTRLKTAIGVSHKYSKNMRTEAYVGWDQNKSNDSDRAYSGVVGGINLRITWD